MNKFFDPKFTLQEWVNELSSDNLDFNKHRDDVNKVIYNTVLQYLTSYLQIKSTSIEEIKNNVESIMKKLTEWKNIESNINWMISEKNELWNNHFSIVCLLDIQQTSSIIKEIIFWTYNDINNWVFKSVDLGSGTWILSLWALISAKRNKYKKWELNLYDLSEFSIDNSKRVLEEIDKDFRIKWNHWNIFKKDLSKLWVQNMWISETISDITPSFWYDIDDNEIIKYSDDSIIPFDIPWINMWNYIITQELIDPYPELFQKSMEEIPNFIEDIKSWKSFMFPDFVNKQYFPDKEDSTMEFKTYSEWWKLSLWETGEEFKNFPKIYNKDSRWKSKEERRKTINMFLNN